MNQEEYTITREEDMWWATYVLVKKHRARLARARSHLYKSYIVQIQNYDQ